MADLPIEFPLELYQGADYRAVVTVRAPQTPEQEAAGTPGDPLDITGWAALAQIRSKVADSDPEVNATITVNILDQVASRGKLELVLTDEQTRLLGQTLGKKGVWDLKLTDTQDFTLPYLAGPVTVTKEVSRPVPAP